MCFEGKRGAECGWSTVREWRMLDGEVREVGGGQITQGLVYSESSWDFIPTITGSLCVVLSLVLRPLKDQILPYTWIFLLWT